ncbi:MAG: lipoprotein [Spiroplasma phoeniceum]|nr:MAG: lipoprotein [Spiroplasma phoeniceum]UZQ32164.1 MAG: lipoprotein [Spiroplasma phoeniceum]
MRKLLSIFAVTTLVTASSASTVACSGTPQGNTIPTFIYNGNQKFSHAPTATGKSTNGIDDVTQSEKDENGAPYEYSLQGGQLGLINNAINPILHGINLTKDNSLTTGRGAKWTDEQIASCLKRQKDELIKTTKTDVQDPFDNSKKINKKVLWEEFFNNYSTSYDSHYSQVAFLANENKTILNKTNDNLVTMTGNAEKTKNKEWVKEQTWPDGKKNPYTPSSLKVLSPIASILEWLNDPKNGYNQGYDQIDQNRGYQSARYLAIVIPNLTIRFEFEGEYNRFTFTATIDKLVGYANYLVYENPNSKKDSPTYGHQWFFLSYGFYDFESLKDNDYHHYNFNAIPDDAKIDQNIKIALGFVKKNDDKGILTDEEDKEVGKRGQFPTPGKDYTFPALKWKINVDSITDQYK